jgi:hypothetical protein
VRVEDAAGRAIGRRQRQRGEGRHRHRSRRLHCEARLGYQWPACLNGEARLLGSAGRARVGSRLGEQLRWDGDRELAGDGDCGHLGVALSVAHQRDSPSDGRGRGGADSGRGLGGGPSLLSVLGNKMIVDASTYITGDSTVGSAPVAVGVTVGVTVVVLVTVTWMVVGAATSEHR